MDSDLMIENYNLSFFFLCAIPFTIGSISLIVLKIIQTKNSYPNNKADDLNQ